MNKEYPINKNNLNHLWLALILSVWVFVFLFFAEPFDIHNFTITEKIALGVNAKITEVMSYFIVQSPVKQIHIHLENCLY